MRYKARKQEWILCEENYKELSDQLRERKVKKLYLFRAEEENAGTKIAHKSNS